MRLEAVFPGLADTRYERTSDPDELYNCIACAAGDNEIWWWPGPEDEAFWPQSIPRVATLAAFDVLFASLGYVRCPDETVEPGVEEIALFADPDNSPTHAARQLPSGKWTSKLGQKQDIEHELHALAGDVYGRVVRIYRRPAPG